MSKASEYAKRWRENKRPAFDLGTGRIARVEEEGHLYLAGELINSAKALAFGKWLVDTFGETE